MEEGRIVDTRQCDSGFDPLKESLKLLDGAKQDRIMATGYGRHLLEVALDAPTVTEIKAYAVGAKSLFPEVRTILDIGGQDSKAIALTPAGRVLKFEMNDRCAAGTGKFLEIMARTLGFPLEEFGPGALKGRGSYRSAACAPFSPNRRSPPSWPRGRTGRKSSTPYFFILRQRLVRGMPRNSWRHAPCCSWWPPEPGRYGPSPGPPGWTSGRGRGCPLPAD
jgi:hypothetical protein